MNEKLLLNDNLNTILLAHIHDIIVCCDLNYNINEFNSAAERFFLCKKEKVLGKNYIELCMRLGIEIISSLEMSELLIRKTIIKSIKINRHNIENIFNWTIVVVLDQQNKAAGVIFIGNNITNVTAENYMQNFFFYLEELSASLPGYFYWKDKEGRYLGCSEDLLRSANLSRQEVIGKRDIEIWPEMGESFEYHDRETMQQNKLLTFKEEINLPNGEKQYFIAMKIPLKDYAGNIIGIIGNSIDITERVRIQEELSKEKEELKRVNKIKDEFLFNMKHDLRTPFSGILSLSTYLEEQETDLEKREHITDIKKSAQALLNMVNSIFEYLKFQTEQKTFLLQKFSLQDLVKSTSGIFRAVIKDKKLDFNIEYDENIPKILIGDKSCIIRILMNLLGNAIKFTNNGSVVLRIQLAKQLERQAIVKLIVEDTGIGIPKDKYDFIFEHFSKVIPSYRGLYEGLGLGLSFVKQIVDYLEGEIKVQSELNKGSIFTCILPFKLPLLQDDDIGDSSISSIKELQKTH